MKQFFGKIAYGFRRFMTGRNGPDHLVLAVIGLSIVIDLVYTFTHFIPLYFVSTALTVYAVFRMLSRNIPKRRAENAKFLSFFSRLRDLRTHHIYRCSSCGQKIRVPRKHGKKVEITCPKCGNRFIKTI